MNIVILGHLVLDEIHTVDGAIIESAGGVTFPLSAFAAAVEPEDVLIPVFPYGNDAEGAFHDLLSRYPNINASYCTEVSKPNTRVRLFHDTQKGYNTQLVSSLDAVSRDTIDTVLPDAQLVYLNMMTGHDILPEDARCLRGNNRLVYFDLHMVAYRVRSDGHREPAPPVDWRIWASVGDVLHCNEQEFAAFLPQLHTDDDRSRFLFDIYDLRCIVVTRGDAGVDIYSENNETLHVPAAPVTRLVDTTGCGDTFGSVFALGLARGETPATAADRASAAAAFVASLSGSHGMENLHTVIRRYR